MAEDNLNIIILKAHKSFDKIKEEYGVEWEEGELMKLGGLMMENRLKDALELLCEIGDRHGLKGKTLGAFIYDTMRTAHFYLQALKALKDVLGE